MMISMSSSREIRSTAASTDLRTSEDWGRRISRGEPEAIHHVRARVRRILSSRHLRIATQEREDLEQEIMTSIWQAVNRPGFDFAAGFWGFVEVVAARRCIDWVRARRTHHEATEDALKDGREGPLQRVLADERTRLALDALAALDPPCRKLITMRLDEGLSYREMSLALSKSEGALRVQMYRCVRRVQQILKSRVDGEGITTAAQGLTP